MGDAQFDLATIDYVIVGVYFVAVMFHGWWAGRGKTGAKDYFLAGGKLPWYLIGFSLLASQMSGSSFVGLMGGTYAEGMVMFNYEWTAVIVLIFFAVFMLPTFLRAGLYTIPEYLENRYSPNARRAFSLFTLLAIMFIDSAGALYAGGLVITSVIPIDLWMAIAVLALVAGIYTIMGGLSAVVVTDTVQAVLLMLGAGLIFVIGLSEIGGWGALFEDLPDEKTRLYQPIDDDFLPWPGMLGVILLGFYYWTLNQFVVQRTLGAKSLDEGRKGALLAGGLKLLNLFLMIIPGLIAFQLYPDLETADLAFPSLAFDLLPIGLRGLILTALIAALMSSLDSALNAAGTLVTMDFVKPAKPELSDETLTKVGRVVTGIAMILAAIYAPMIAGFESLFEYFQSALAYVAPPIVAVFLVGLFWRGASAPGALAGIGLGILVGVPIFVTKEVMDVWSTAGLPDIHFTIMAVIMFAVGAALVAGVSVITQQPEKDAIDSSVIKWPEIKESLASEGDPLWFDFRVWSLALIIICAALVSWFWL
ncbi:MAG: sodium:solute symporter family transporter [Oceanicaulis sp.]